MLKYKLQVFNEGGDVLLTLNAGVERKISLQSDFKGDPEITFGDVTKSIKEWAEFMKEVK